MFLSDVFYLRDKLIDLGEVVSNKSLTTIIIDALPEERYSITKLQSIRDSDLELEEIVSMMEMIFINCSERSLVLKRSQETYRKVRNSGREPRMRDNRVLESAMILTCHNCKKPEHKMKYRKQLMEKSDKSRNVESGNNK